MTTRVTLNARSREGTGKGAARSLRRAGFVPGVIYGHGLETRACQVEARQLERLMTTSAFESTLIDLKFENGDTSSVLIREVQVHPIRPLVLHVDFLAVRKGEKVKLEVPIRIVGLAPGVKEGGILEHLRHEVEIRCLPTSIPDALELDVSALAIGDSATVSALKGPEGVEVLSEPSAVVVSVVPPAVHKVEAEAEAAVAEAPAEEAEPEVIGRGKAGEEEEEEEAEEEG
jgi:large subunit ribosomal protein L25